VIKEAGLREEDNIFVLRLAAFNATHDSRSKNLTRDCIMALITKLEKAGTVFISSESELEPALKKYQYNLNPVKYHDLIHYSKLFIGDGSTSAVEAAILGVPSLQFEKNQKQRQGSTDLTRYAGLYQNCRINTGCFTVFMMNTRCWKRQMKWSPNIKNFNVEWKARRAKFLIVKN
jgi:predicted glycosyltransferase